METESKSDVFKKREEDVINKFITEVQDKHFLEELGPGGNWKVKDGMKNEYEITEDVLDLVEDTIDTISFLESELASLREQLKQKEEVIRELIPIAEVGQAYYRQNPGFNWVAEREKSKAIIAKAKNLLQPQ